MAGPVPPGVGIGQLQHGYDWSLGSTAGVSAAANPRPTHAISAWTALNKAVAVSLPASLILAGQYHRATLVALRRRSRIRR